MANIYVVFIIHSCLLLINESSLQRKQKQTKLRFKYNFHQKKKSRLLLKRQKKNRILGSLHPCIYRFIFHLYISNPKTKIAEVLHESSPVMQGYAADLKLIQSGVLIEFKLIPNVNPCFFQSFVISKLFVYMQKGQKSTIFW